jgi:hypothetical protein
MTAHDHDVGLDAHSRAALLHWIDSLDAEAPSGFADGVLARMRDAPAAALADDAPAATRRRSRKRWLATGAAVLAAAALVLFIGRSLRASAEAGERAERLALEVPASASLLELRSAALATLQAQCTPCHSSTSGEAVRGALEVFDVEDPRWYLSMSERQLGVAMRRLDGAVETAEREGFRAYVDGEIAHRRASAPTPVTGGRARTGT